MIMDPGPSKDQRRETARDFLCDVIAGQDSSLAVCIPGGSLTRKQLRQLVADVAADLALFGVSRGDVVATALPNPLEFIVLLLGITSLGASVAPLDSSIASRFTFYCNDVAARFFILPAPHATEVKKQLPAELFDSLTLLCTGPLTVTRDSEGTSFRISIQLRPPHARLISEDNLQTTRPVDPKRSASRFK